MYTEETLKKLIDHPSAAELTVTIAIAGNAESKNWKTISVSWPKLVTAFSRPEVTEETFAEYKASDKPTQGKCKDVGGFMGGTLSDKCRKREFVTSRTLLTLDLDGVERDGVKGLSVDPLELMDDIRTIHGFEAAMYSTHSSSRGHPRVRLVIPLSRPLTPEEYRQAAKQITSELSMMQDIDDRSFLPEQFMFWPSVSMDMAEDFIFEHAAGSVLEADAVLGRVMDVFKPEESKASKTIADPGKWVFPAPRNHEEAIAKFAQWAAHDKANLQERNTYYLSAICVIAKAVQTGEIELRTAEESARLLALGNPEWEVDNVTHLHKEIRNQNITTEYTYKDKFMWEPGSDPVDDFDFVEGSAKPFKRTSINGSELRKTEFPPLTYFVDDLITPGLTVLAAPPKSGKSWLILSMLMAISSGAPFLGRKTKQAPSFYLALEDSERRIDGRMRKIDPVNDYPFLEIQTEAVPMISIPDRNGNQKVGLTWENDFLKFLDEYHKLGFRVFVVDVFQKIRPGSTNPNQYEGDYKEVAPLQRWAKAKDSALILIHHFKKGTQGYDPVERVGGSTGITGAADTIITIEKEMRDSAISKFMITGRDVSMQTFDATFTDGRWAISDMAEATRRAQELERQEYEANPLVRTIKHLLTHDSEVKITADGLQKEMNELCGWDALGHKVNKTAISKLSLQLLTNDKITYEYKQSGIRWHIFQRKDRMIFPGYEQTELDLPDVSSDKDVQMNTS